MGSSESQEETDLIGLWNRSLARLSQGDYSAWPRHEWIRSGHHTAKDTFIPTPTYGQRIWGGEVEPITLLINADFGMGDTICFWRFVPDAVRRVAKVIVRCDADLIPLLDHFNVEFVSKEEPLPAFDKIIHMMALPGVLDYRSIHCTPYLNPNTKYHPHPIIWDLCLDRSDKIGVCWAGNPFNPTDNIRSVPWETFIRPFRRLGLKPISLVKHLAPPSDFFDVRGLMDCWNDTAYLLQTLSLVVTVDTAVAHLAGAMGIRTWLLLPEQCDWRWGKGSRTPWYLDVEILRQHGGGWDHTMEEVEDAFRLEAEESLCEVEAD